MLAWVSKSRTLDGAATMSSASMLTVAEEVFLLTLDQETGKPNTELASHSVHNAIAGALLMDLSLHNRIDTDLRRLFVVDPTPVDEPISDQVLSLIVAAGDARPTGFWLDVLAVDGDALREQLREQLVRRGIMTAAESSGIGLAGERKDADKRGLPMLRVKKRLGLVVLSAEIPDPRDIMIISLANACSLWPGLFHETAYAEHGAKIEQISKMDLIGREVARIIRTERT